MSRIVFNVATSSYALFRHTGIHQPDANGEANDVINLSKCAFGDFKFDKLLANIKYIPGVAVAFVVVFTDEFVADGTKERKTEANKQYID